MFSVNYLWPQLKPGTRVVVKTIKPGSNKQQKEYWWEPGIKLDDHFVQLDRGPKMGYPADNAWQEETSD